MNLDEYQRAAARTANVDWPLEKQICNAGFGVCGEAGEVAEYLKKVLFHGHNLDLDHLKKELGDCLWYIAVLAKLYGLSLDDIAQANIDKLWQRYPNGFSQEDSIKREDVNGR